MPIADVPTHHGHVYGVLGRLDEGSEPRRSALGAGRLGKRMGQSFPDSHAGYKVRAEALGDELLGWARPGSGRILLERAAAAGRRLHQRRALPARARLERESGSAVRAALGATAGRWRARSSSRACCWQWWAAWWARPWPRARFGRRWLCSRGAAARGIGPGGLALAGNGAALVSMLAGSAVGLLAGSRASRPTQRQPWIRYG